MEKRLLLAAVLSVAVLLLWELVVPKPKRPVPVPGTTATTPVAATPVTPGPGGPAGAASAAPEAPAYEPVAGTQEQTSVHETALLKATFSNRGAVLTSLILKNYTDDEGKPLELVRAAPDTTRRPFALDFARAEDTRAAATALYAVEDGDRSVTYRFSDGVRSIEKTFTLSSGYGIDVKVSVPGRDYAILVGPGLRNPSPKERTSVYVAPTTAVMGGPSVGRETVRADKLKEPRTWTVPSPGFAGVEDNYFLAVLIPPAPTSATVRPVSFPLPEAPADDKAAKNKQFSIEVALAAKDRFAGRAYFGPKDVGILESVGVGLERTVNFGWFGVIARPLLWLLQRTHAFVGNYGVAILIVTFLIRLLLFPLTHKSYKSMKKMQKLAPKMKAIQEKYKKARSDAAQRAKMNQEMMALYQTEGYNPMSGCLPIVLQMPILFAFYYVLANSIDLRHAPFLYIRDLAGVDRTYILVILMVVTMFIQQRMTPSTMDPVQKRIFLMMPFLMGFFMKDAPSGLVLYWFFSNVLTIFQQLVINKIVKDDEPEKPAGKPGRSGKPARVKPARA
ncbi:MAG TPA: membrane protein insertase YidC [Thermoanaerobaculia bacterium]|jgi:YidC/Oxa1 family membrane protein insertase